MPRPTEWTYASDLKEWVNVILGTMETEHVVRATVEEMVENTQERADILIYNRNNDVNTVLSVKRPSYNPLDEDFRMETANYAREYDSRYYATHNINILALWDSVTDQLIDQFPFTYVKELAAFRSKEEEIRQSLKAFLDWFKQRLELQESPHPLDESIANVLKRHVTGIIQETPFISYIVDNVSQDVDFRKQFDQWVLDQGWNKADTKDEVERCAEILIRQFLYTFVNKCIFYLVLRTKYNLPELTLPSDADHKAFQSLLKTFFQFAEDQSGDYETVFDTNFVDTLPAPAETLRELMKVINYVKSFDYSSIEYDVVGKIYERLIMDEQRHLMGQFFTRPDVVDLILGFCIKNQDLVGMDPACGSGTFLVRSYYRFKYLGNAQSHRERLRKLWGVDIARFPAHLSTINLAIRDLLSNENYPQIIHKDFFDIEGSNTTVEIGIHGNIPLNLNHQSKAEVQTLSNEKFEKELPVLDFVVGNPPYTRHEELHKELFGEDYKDKLKNRIKDDFPDVKLSKRAGIYSYFIPHGFKFLKEDGGRLGFVTLRQWLDTDYGESVRRFVGKYGRVIAIIECQDEKWFPDAQMLPIICVFERIKEPNLIDAHWVKFIQLKKNLDQLIPSIVDIRDSVSQIRRLERVDEIATKIEQLDSKQDGKSYTYQDKDIQILEDDDMRAIMLRQQELEPAEKWSKYLRAPAPYFKVMEKAEDLLCPLGSQGTDEGLVKVKYGVKPGVTKFFSLGSSRNPFTIHKRNSLYTLEKEGRVHFEIEQNYVFPAITKIKPHKKIKIQKPDGYLLSVSDPKLDLQKAGMKVLNYITWGEKPIYKVRGSNEYIGVHQSPTCSSRDTWHDLGLKDRDIPPLICPGIFWGTHIVYWNDANAYTTDSQVEFHPKDSSNAKALCAILNSTFAALMFEFAGRYIENRDKTISNQIKTGEFRKIPMINIDKLDSEIIDDLKAQFKKLSDRKVETLDKEVEKDDRKKLDEIVFVDILGLSEAEMKEIVTATAKLFTDRIQRFQNENLGGEED